MFLCIINNKSPAKNIQGRLLNAVLVAFSFRFLYILYYFHAKLLHTPCEYSLHSHRYILPQTSLFSHFWAISGLFLVIFVYYPLVFMHIFVFYSLHKYSFSPCIFISWQKGAKVVKCFLVFSHAIKCVKYVPRAQINQGGGYDSPLNRKNQSRLRHRCNP